MFSLRTACVAIALVSSSVLPSVAASLKNGDSKDHKLQIIVGDKSEDVTIAAGSRIAVCPKTCTIKIQGQEDFKADSPDVLWIQKGKLVKSLE